MPELTAKLVAELVTWVAELEAEVACLQVARFGLQAENNPLRAQVQTAECAAKGQVTPFARKTRKATTVPLSCPDGQRHCAGRLAPRLFHPRFALGGMCAWIGARTLRAHTRTTPNRNSALPNMATAPPGSTEWVGPIPSICEARLAGQARACRDYGATGEICYASCLT
jgi:hypothetical protein